MESFFEYLESFCTITLHIVLVLIGCRSVGIKERLNPEEYSDYVRGIWVAIRRIQGSPTLVKLLDTRTPEVIPI